MTKTQASGDWDSAQTCVEHRGQSGRPGPGVEGASRKEGAIATENHPQHPEGREGHCSPWCGEPTARAQGQVEGHSEAGQWPGENWVSLVQPLELGSPNPNVHYVPYLPVDSSSPSLSSPGQILPAAPGSGGRHRLRGTTCFSVLGGVGVEQVLKRKRCTVTRNALYTVQMHRAPDITLGSSI